MDVINALLNRVDPYRQSFIFFRYGFYSVLLLCAAVVAVFMWRADGIVHGLLQNIFVYLPNYLIHEFSHRFWCTLRWEWWCYACGSAVEIGAPLFAYSFCLQLRGGRWISPFALYWLSTALFSAGKYAADARASALPLTSSDMMSNFEPGVVKGDWHYILTPLGLLQWDVWIGNLLMFAAAFCLVFAFYSLWYSVAHSEDFLRRESETVW